MQNILNKALSFAQVKHKGQEYNGQPFIVHPIMTASLLEVLGADENLICAGYLHDILEDTETTYEELEEKFNEDVASLVLEVTKTEYNTFPNLKTRRGILLKFADRMSNLMHIESWSPEKQQRYLEKSKFWKP